MGDQIEGDALEETYCPLCASERYNIVHNNIMAPFVRKRTSIVKCLNCSLQYYNPMPTDEAFRKGYEGANGSELYDAEPIDREINFNYYLDIISKFTEPPGKILDIGCCQGYFLNLAKKRQWETFGIEPSADMAIHCNIQGHKVVNSQISDTRFEGSEKFDIITLWDVIEHLRYPVDDFKNINTFLNVNGHVCLWTKNIDSLRAVIMGRHYPFIADQHIVYYSPVTIKILLEKTGFELLKIYRPSLKMTFNRIMKRLRCNFQIGFFGNISIPITFYDNMLVFAKKIRDI